MPSNPKSRNCHAILQKLTMYRWSLFIDFTCGFGSTVVALTHTESGCVQPERFEGDWSSRDEPWFLQPS